MKNSRRKGRLAVCALLLLLTGCGMLTDRQQRRAVELARASTERPLSDAERAELDQLEHRVENPGVPPWLELLLWQLGTLAVGGGVVRAWRGSPNARKGLPPGGQPPFGPVATGPM